MSVRNAPVTMRCFLDSALRLLFLFLVVVRRYTAPHPLEEEFVNSGLSEHAAAEAKKEEAKKAQERQEEERETLKTKAAEEARTLMERLKPEYLERLMEWRPGQPPPPGFDPPSKEEEPEGAPAMPVPREEAMKSPVVEAKRRQEEEKEEKYVPQVSLELGADVGEGEEELEEVLEEEEEHNDDDESD